MAESTNLQQSVFRRPDAPQDNHVQDGRFSLVALVRPGADNGERRQAITAYSEKAQSDKPQGEQTQTDRPQPGKQSTDNIAAIADKALTPFGKAEIRDGRISKPALENILTRARQTDSDSIVVMRDGEVVAKWFSDDKEKLMLTNSVTKSVANLAVGQLFEQGKLTLDEKVSDFFPEWKQGEKKDVTIRELMNHTSGLPFHAKEISLQAALSAHLDNKPGTTFEYSSAAVDVLSGVVEKITGKSLDHYADEHIFKPLGITDYKWNEDKEGHAGGGSGLWAKATDLAKLGQLMANDGMWKGQRIIGSEWIAQSTKPSQNQQENCGLLWWLEDPHFNSDQSNHHTYTGSEGFSARGAKGQWVVVYPEENLVAVRQIDNDKYKGGDDEFSDFSPMVKNLATGDKLEIHTLAP